MKLGTAIRDLKRGMTYYPELAKVIGGVCPAVLFCCLSWKDKDLTWESEDGMQRRVRKTMEDLADETGLTEREMRGSRDLLERIGAIKCNYLRLEHIVEFEVDLERVDELCADWEAHKASVKTSDAHLSERQMAPDETSDRHLSKRQIDHCLEKKEENKSDNLETISLSPKPGEGSTSKHAQYDFGTFKSFYPHHRMSDKNERASRSEWNAINGDAQTKVAIIQHLSAMASDPEWTKEHGKYVPTPQKYLAEERWKNELSWSALYRPECQAVVDYFLESTGQSAAVNKLTPDRLQMLASRIHEAKAMKLEIDPNNERSLMKDAIDAAWSSAYYKKHPEAFTLESVYGSAERFEKLIKREVPACS